MAKKRVVRRLAPVVRVGDQLEPAESEEGPANSRETTLSQRRGSPQVTRALEIIASSTSNHPSTKNS